MTVEASTFQGVLREMLRPYPALDEGRIAVNGDDVPVDDRGATPLALVFHELATNAAKYGALSNSEGRLAVTSRLDGDNLLVDWVERDGPAMRAPPSRSGFGTRLIEMSVVQQLNGSIEREWCSDGLKVRLTLQPHRLVRR